MTVLGDLQYETVEDVAALVGCAPSTYREWFRRGRAPGVKLPGCRRILVPHNSVAAWLAGCDLDTRVLADGGQLVQPAATKRWRQS